MKILCAGWIAALAFCGCRDSHAGHAHESESESAKLIVTRPLRRDTEVVRDYVCQIHSARNIEVRALGRGYLESVKVAEGQKVKAGVGPLINCSAIQAAFKIAHAEQVAAIYRYQQKVLKAYVEVVNQLSQINNMGQSYALKSRQVEALSESASLSSQLFDSARADYTEVLLTQREALEARIDLVEIRQTQLTALVKAYKAIGGGVTQTNRVTMPVPKPVRPE